MRPIDADALKTWFDNHYDHEEFSVGYISWLINEQPTIEVVPERKKGWWHVKHDEIFADRHFCSCCGEYANADLYGEEILSAYCPNCGADMRGEQNG